jgi:hypothetical protein
VNTRKITSLTLVLAFVLLMLTSVVLYVVPEGRVAYWSDWRWLGLSKTQWGDIHTNSGFLFLMAGLVHLGYNWKAMLAYLKNRSRELRIFTPAFVVAVVVNLVVLGGTLLHLPPFSSILEFGHSFKEAAAVKFGEPPYGHAELSSLALFAKRTGLELAGIKTGLNKAGIRFTGEDQTLLAIAQANHITPKAVYDALQAGTASKSDSKTSPLPDQPFTGMGRMPLKELCSQYGLNQQQIVAALAAKGIKADPEKSLKEIAGAHGTDPHALFALIHETATQK